MNRSVRRGSIGIFVVIAISLAIGIFESRRLRSRTDSQTLVTELVSAVGQQRFFEPRMTGGFAWSEIKSPTRGSVPHGLLSPEVHVAIAQIERSALAASDGAKTAALGKALLIAGEHDRSIAALEAAVKRNHIEPDWQTDLSAAYMVRGANRSQHEDFVRALNAALIAVRLAPRSEEAQFNAALALQANSLTRGAQDTWNRYLALDSESSWAREARASLGKPGHDPLGEWARQRSRLLLLDESRDDRLVDSAVRSLPHACRLLVEDELIPAWGEAIRRNDYKRAGMALRRAELLAHALVSVGGDGLLSASISSISRASSEQARQMARGFIAFGEGRRLFNRTEFDSAAKQFRVARAELLAARNEFWAWAVAYEALCRYQLHDYVGASQQAETAIKFATPANYLALVGRSLWIAALAARSLGQPEKALRMSQEAMHAFADVGEVAHVGAVASTAADLARSIGERQQAWQLLAAVLHSIETEPAAVRRYLCFYNASLFARKDGLLEAALAFQDQAVEAARECAETGALVQAHTQRAAVLLLLNRPGEAEKEIATAHASLDTARDVVRDYMRSELEMTEAGAIQAKDPSRARALLSNAMQTLERLGPDRLPELYLALGRTALIEKNVAEAERQFGFGLSYFERERNRFSDDQLRAEFFGNAQDLYVEAARLQLSQRQSDAAFELSERSRARTLLDADSATNSHGVSLGALHQRLTNGVAFLEFMQLGDEIVCWVVTPDGVDVVRTPVDRTKLENLVESQRSSSISAIAAQDASEYGYDLAIRPILSHLRGARRLVISPDGLLHQVAFVALRDRVTRRFLIEDYELELAPSATWLLTSAMRTKGQEALPLSVLAIGDPAFDRKKNPTLPSLPQAKKEILAVASVYPSSRVIQGDRATRGEFVWQSERFSILHFAGHAVPNTYAPQFSYLLMAPENEDDDGRVRSTDIGKLDLSRTRLVVLSACGTAEGATVFGEGALSLARPFLLAGVSAVVATLWDVEDSVAANVVTEFHRRVASGERASEALRNSQIAVLRSQGSSDSARWAAFIIIGNTTAPVTVPLSREVQ